LRAAALLIRLRARQQINHLLSVYRHRFGAGKRAGTGRKGRSGWLTGGLVGLLMLFGIGNLAYQSIDNMERTARQAELRAAARSSAPVSRPPAGAPRRPALHPPPPAPPTPPAPPRAS